MSEIPIDGWDGSRREDVGYVHPDSGTEPKPEAAVGGKR